MTRYIIKKGRHDASPFKFKLFWKPKILIKTITLGRTCEYNLLDSDQLDINKLLGFGFFNLRKFPFHHWESIRIGWSYDLKIDKANLFTYSYIKGQRNIKYLCSVPLGKPWQAKIVVSRRFYHISISFFDGRFNKTSTASIERGSTPAIAYLLGPYFGGNEKAPHNMNITIQ